ncbi:demethyllactenocin mycarosyltransferase-like [Tetranychus urticae]|uniref:UDP-glycosyltransferase 201B4p n=1 Tax=Tetranychus urticae TaxID=32264 RepID=A0A023R9C0_TETUR|nr:demethyllactenocin mycarosyltransferase-like [Tetranychus urticae]AHX56851.1 UDP-glycosyltransferase 201B4p [Tetranychus urticae]
MTSYRFLVTAIDSYGHINAALGFAEGLKAAGHEVYFAHREKHRHLAVKRGFSFIPFDNQLGETNLEGAIFQWIDAFADKFRQEPLKRFKGISLDEKESLIVQAKIFAELNAALQRIVSDENNKFDGIVSDTITPYPFLYKHSIPWFPLASLNPLILYPKGPPPFSGYSVNSDPSNWDEFREAYQRAHSRLTETTNENLTAAGLDPAKFDSARFVSSLQTIGFYHYPADLDYIECEPKDPNWHRVDAWVRQPDFDTEFVIPEKLQDKPGKVIYFSLGSLGSADLVIMKKLIAILAKSPHKFIISKGPRGDALELADNMWGENYVNQIAVVRGVDLVITHGGNNTFTETLYYGKPMIVIPYFYDQFDNAQRVVDKKVGFRINPYELDEDYLLSCIEKIFEDKEMQDRVKAISHNMRNSNSFSQAIKMIERRIEQSKSKS